MKIGRFLLFILSVLIYFYGCSKKNNKNFSKGIYKSEGHIDVNINWSYLKGLDYHTKFDSKFVKYAFSKQVFLDYVEGYQVLSSYELSLERDSGNSQIEYISKIPDLSKEVSAENLSFVIYFDFDSADLRKDQEIRLMKFLKKIKSKEVNKVILKGYTDDRGSEDYNYALSYKRALAVKHVLKKIIKNNSIRYVIFAKGKCCFVSDKHEMNRRVEIEIY